MSDTDRETKVENVKKRVKLEVKEKYSCSIRKMIYR